MKKVIRLKKNGRSIIEDLMEDDEIESSEKEKENAKDLSVYQLIGKIVKLSNDEPISVTGNIQKYVEELGSRLNLTPMQALLLSVFVNQSDDDSIRPRDIANHFDGDLCSVLSVNSDIQSLVEREIIQSVKNRTRLRGKSMEIVYRVPPKTIASLEKGCLPERSQCKALYADDWIESVSELLEQRSNDEVDDEMLMQSIDNLVKENIHLEMVRKIRDLHLSGSDLVLYLVMSLCYINDRDDHIVERDFRDYFERREMRHHVSDLAFGKHILMEKNLVEHSNANGMVETEVWQLTDLSKTDIYSELNLLTRTKKNSKLKTSDSIEVKELFYSDSLKKQIADVEKFFDSERLGKIQERLEKKGMRKGIAILFYGAPGTGKTETVLQLARMSGRDIMQVDIPSIRSKWVGETEKNIKNVFDSYKRACKDAERLPILLFNEADAILTSRIEQTTHSVDKMENAMQNIILQEMETLDGIMVATTNLTGVLDPAFERRFLYKLEFEKPDIGIRSQIWQSMLPELTDKQAKVLAERYEFTGGQIENITRKNIISNIIELRDDIDFDTILENCKTELIKSKETRRVGFID